MNKYKNILNKIIRKKLLYLIDMWVIMLLMINIQILLKLNNNKIIYTLLKVKLKKKLEINIFNNLKIIIIKLNI